MIIDPRLNQVSPLRQAIRDRYLADEAAVARELIDKAQLSSEAMDRIAERARALVLAVRQGRMGQGSIDAFLHEFELSSREGVVLMCLAEALLRVPDAATADKLIQDKIAEADWAAHLGHSDSLFVNASTWALMLTGRVIQVEENGPQDLAHSLRSLVRKSGEPVIRAAVTQAMRILGRQFVMGRTISEALERAEAAETKGYRHSYDMLGEAARTMEDARRYREAYNNAITALGEASKTRGPVESPGISIKLSALHPRYEFAQRDRVITELYASLKGLALEAKRWDIGLTIDAEEADRLDISLDLLEMLAVDQDLGDWQGLGLAVQAYQKRGLPVIEWLSDLAERSGRRLMVRLVKGAYWDSEVKHAQEQGLEGYPVFTRKLLTDVSYLACAKRLLDAGDRFYPQFATHNAQSLAAILEMASGRKDFEFQRLHGMGEALYAEIVGPGEDDYRCRVYAPVGSHEELLAYLVRRLLENGANTSFVNRIQDEKLPIEAIIADPVERARRLESFPHPAIPLPGDIFKGAEGRGRDNAQGFEISDPANLAPLAVKMEAALKEPRRSGPIIGGRAMAGERKQVLNPANSSEIVGEVVWTSAEMAKDALARAHRAWPDWDSTPADQRAACLERLADLMERHGAELMALCIKEAGKTLNDAQAELREAVDFCRYYAARARMDFAGPEYLPGPTGERNEIELRGRGVFLCIAPWNFPLAIFLGQVTAALAAGNAVLAKPAEQTGLIAHRAFQLLHEAGVPDAVAHLLPGDGGTLGQALMSDDRVAGVAFTGSTETAKLINRALAARDGAIVPLIAETGGQNAMLVDSTALPEQVIRDVVVSAFQSAGQRCSALRVLFVQEDVADKMIEMLKGAMAELQVGDPANLKTDVGPVIDAEALAMLQSHVDRFEGEGRLIAKAPLGPDCANGYFCAPSAFEIDSIAMLEREVFGPILHLVRYKAEDLDRMLDEINATGYGLTLGVHSRIDSTVEHICKRMRVGNAYVNRNIIGAVVGVQPFGGRGLSGTGPKAGGPRYLHRFATEKTISTDTTAAGGNASLMAMTDGLRQG